MVNNRLEDNILLYLKKKYNYLTDIYKTTKNLETASLEDETAFSSLLSTRQDTMNNIDKIDKQIKSSIALLPTGAKEKIQNVLQSKNVQIKPDNTFQSNIFDIAKQNKTLLKNIIETDKKVNAKLKKLKNNK